MSQPEIEPKFLLLASFVADCLDCLIPEINVTLSELTNEHLDTEDWHAAVHQEFGCTKDSLLERFKFLLGQNMSAQMALVFMMTEAACEEPRPYLAMTIGHARKLESMWRGPGIR